VTTDVKICGINEPDGLAAAVSGGARYVGLVFFPRSPRAVTPAVAAMLAALVPPAVRVVGLFVDPGDAELAATLPAVRLDLLQLHGGESPERVAAVRDRWQLPVMKAFRIAQAEDFAEVEAYAPVVERYLFDAKPPPSPEALPGGNGLAFDWRLLSGRRFGRPWMLAGGLTVETVGASIRLTGAPAVDVSSGVECRPGIKDPALIAAFLEAAAAAARPAPPVDIG